MLFLRFGKEVTRFSEFSSLRNVNAMMLFSTPVRLSQLPVPVDLIYAASRIISASHATENFKFQHSNLETICSRKKNISPFFVEFVCLTLCYVNPLR